MSTQPKTYVSPERYLEIERAAEYRSEYLAGEMFAMAGGRRSHNRISMNTGAELWRQLRGHGCEVYGSDMRIFVPATSFYTYPDVVAVCGDQRFTDGTQDTLVNPVLIVEVLSPSTEGYDRGRKFDNYKSIAALREYLLLSSDRIHADRYTRRPDGFWLLASVDRLGNSIALESVGATLNMADVYEKVEMPGQSVFNPPPNTGL